MKPSPTHRACLALLPVGLLLGCQLPGPGRAQAPQLAAVAQGLTRAQLDGSLGDRPIRIAIQGGQLHLAWADATFEGQHGLLSVGGRLTQAGRPDRTLAVRMAGGKLVGELGEHPLELKVQSDEANQQRLLKGTWGPHAFQVAFKTAPDAKLQLRFEGSVEGQALRLEGAGPWQGEQFAIYSCLFLLLAAAS